MTIIVPILNYARGQSRIVSCASNIKQLLAALIAYDSEHGSFPNAFDNSPPQKPPPGGYAGYIQYDRSGWWWFNRIEGLYNKSEQVKTVVTCPSKNLTENKLSNDILCGNYGINRSICKNQDDIFPNRKEFVGQPMTSTLVLRPEQTILLIDCGYSMITWWHAANIPPSPLNSKRIEDTAYIPGLSINSKKTLRQGQQSDAIDGRHPKKKVNIGFVAGNVTAQKSENMLVERISSGYTNLTPLWKVK